MNCAYQTLILQLINCNYVSSLSSHWMHVKSFLSLGIWITDCTQFLLENRLNGCQIFGQFFLNNPNIHTPLDWCTWPGVSAYAAWHQMVPVCLERWCTEANEATQTHCYNPVAPAYSVWAYYSHGWQRRCQEDPVSLPSGGLEKTTRSSPHHVVQHRPTWSETTPLHHLTLPEAADLAQNRPLWRMMSTYGATQSWVACQKRRQRHLCA